VRHGGAVRIDVVVNLDGGGTVRIIGEDLSAEDVHDVFTLLAGHTVSSPPRHPQGGTPPP
jgi:hypothetical protein